MTSHEDNTMSSTPVELVDPFFLLCDSFIDLCLLCGADIASETGINVDDVRSTLKCLDVVTSPVTWYSLLSFF